MGKFDLTFVYLPGKDKTVTDCLSGWAYPARKGMTDVFAHSNDAETAEAHQRIIDSKRMMEADGVKCVGVMAPVAPLGSRVSRAVLVLAPEGAQSNKPLFQRVQPPRRLDR